ncbi:hypothetical protein RJT34_15512 [Clitoria ternatea]|uniref:Uncharacterized protein n=1 Tax=Clitoria ternatea TaxID=43366 RepID=A0AAN9J6R9_CLITE
MSKKNNLAKRKKQHEFDLQREKQHKVKKEKKFHALQIKMKVDGNGKKEKRIGEMLFPVGKKKVKVAPFGKPKAVKAMEVDI